MGISVTEFVISTLKEKGIRADHARPGGNMMVPQAVVAAVSQEQLDQNAGSVTVRVDVIGLSRLGAAACEEIANRVCTILEQTGGICRQEGVGFQAATGMFCIPVFAVYYGPPSRDAWDGTAELRITLNGEYLLHVTRFSAEQKAVGPKPMPEDGPWEFVLEEFFPVGTKESPECPQTGFSVSLHRGGANEVYAGCAMTQRQRITDASGIRQIRRGTAAYRTANTPA